MRVLLVQPGIQGNEAKANEIILPPIGITTLAGVLIRKRHDVRLFDGTTSKNQIRDLIETIKNFKPEVVGITSNTAQFETAKTLIKTVRHHSRAKIILGGIHPTMFPQESRKIADIVVKGEGELVIEKALTASGIIKGIPVQDLDSIPFPAYELLDLQKYNSPQISKKPFMSMITSRGCPFNCTFCDASIIFGKKFRYQSARRIMAEMKYLESIGIKEVVFKDSEFTLNNERIEELCHLLIKNKVKIIWACNARIGCGEQDFFYNLKRAGCYIVQFGVESGNQKTLNRLKKGITTAQARETFKMAKKAGLNTIANFLIGCPGESWKDTKSTIDFSKELNPDFAAFSHLTAYPGTELREGELPDKELVRGWIRKANKSFYLRPSYIFKRLFSLSPVIWKNNLAGLRILFGGRK